jgi:TPP-dependent pyruvate/acetoin dehydrogenase alpha subunit
VNRPFFISESPFVASSYRADLKILNFIWSKLPRAGQLSRDGDPNSNGRNMLEQFSSRELRLVSQTACTGTQYLPAVGVARAVIRLDPHSSSDDQTKYRHPEELDAVVVEDPIRRAEEDLLKEGVQIRDGVRDDPSLGTRARQRAASIPSTVASMPAVEVSDGTD